MARRDGKAHPETVSFDKDDRPGADGSAAGWEDGGDQLAIPDDIRELEADVRAYHRERRATRRRMFLRRIFLGSRFGITLPILMAALFLAALYSIVMLVVASPRPQAPRGVALASPKVAPGRPGGLLPKLRISDKQGTFTPLRSLRPGVVLLTPTNCNCAGPIRSVATAAEHSRLGVTLIGTTAPATPSGIADSLAQVRTEPTGALLRTYHVGTKPVAVLIRPNGVVSKVLTTLPPASKFDADVRALTSTGPAR
jgi:hypothetical protein